MFIWFRIRTQTTLVLQHKNPASKSWYRPCRYLRLRPRRQAANGEHAREPSLLAPKVRVQPLPEIYTTKVRFTRKICVWR